MQKKKVIKTSILAKTFTHLIKDWVVPLSDSGPLGLPGNCYLNNRFNVDARQLSSLNDPHTNLEQDTCGQQHVWSVSIPLMCLF